MPSWNNTSEHTSRTCKMTGTTGCPWQSSRLTTRLLSLLESPRSSLTPASIHVEDLNLQLEFPVHVHNGCKHRKPTHLWIECLTCKPTFRTRCSGPKLFIPRKLIRNVSPLLLTKLVIKFGSMPAIFELPDPPRNSTGRNLVRTRLRK